MDLLLSIKPKYVSKIFNGSKKYEFRKKLFKNDNVEHVLVYSSNPVKDIIGYFTLSKIIHAEPKILWDFCHAYAGITKTEFFEYFKNAETGYAIEISNFKRFYSSLALEDIGIKKAPQSFMYVEMPVKIEDIKIVDDETLFYWHKGGDY